MRRPRQFNLARHFALRIRTAAVEGKALDLCQALFLADGARSNEEDAVLQNLRKLLE